MIVLVEQSSGSLTGLREDCESWDLGNGPRYLIEYGQSEIRDGRLMSR